MKAKWLTPLMIATFSSALAVGSAVSAGGMGSGGTGGHWHSFNQLDRNSDGRISQQEANADPRLAEHFKRLDSNKNSHLDQGEFAQFETMQRSKHRTNRMEQKSDRDHGDYHEGEHW